MDLSRRNFLIKGLAMTAGAGAGGAAAPHADKLFRKERSKILNNEQVLIKVELEFRKTAKDPSVSNFRKFLDENSHRIKVDRDAAVYFHKNFINADTVALEQMLARREVKLRDLQEKVGVKGSVLGAALPMLGAGFGALATLHEKPNEEAEDSNNSTQEIYRMKF